MAITADEPTAQLAPDPGDGHTESHRGDPFRAFGILGFVLAFFAVLNFAGFVISIIALVRSKRAGFRNGFALAGLVISSLGILATLLIVGVFGYALIDAAQTCARLGDGVHTVGTATYTCSPGSFYVSHHG